MKIFFAQLPLLDHNQDYVTGNIPCASETLAGYIRNISTEVETSIPPFEISGFASNRIIADRILNEKPDLLAFTCYAWNLERSLDIAELVKDRAPGIKTVFGGPEISEGSYCLSDNFSQADLFFSGEGEWFFNHFLRGDKSALFDRASGEKHLIQPGGRLIPAGDIHDPFKNSIPSIMPDGSIFLELTRGCPFRCSYCFYSKNCLTVRELPFQRLIRALNAAPEAGIKEIYILSPTFNSSPDFLSRLETIRSINSGVKLHTEMRADIIDRQIAELIRDAGFTSLEVGIQTLTPAALKNVKRGSDPEKEIKGIMNLKEAGIELKIGIIPGLPGDDPESFMRGAERLNDLGLNDYIEPYSLMVLPGTRIREQLDSLTGYSYQKMPPYFFLEGGHFSFNDQLNIYRKIEDMSGYSKVVNRMPDISHDESGILTRSAGFNGNTLSNWNSDLYRKHIDTNPFTFMIEISSSEPVYEGLPLLLDKFSGEDLFNIIFITESFIDEALIAEYMINRADNSYLQRAAVFNDWKDSLSVKFYQVFSNREKHSRAFDSYSLIEPVYRLDPGGSLPLDHTSGSSMMLAGRGAFSEFSRYLELNYSDAPELVSFESEDEMEKFYKMAGLEYVNYPFKFRSIGLF